MYNRFIIIVLGLSMAGPDRILMSTGRVMRNSRLFHALDIQSTKDFSIIKPKNVYDDAHEYS